MRTNEKGTNVRYGSVAKGMTKKFYDVKIRAFGADGKSRYLTVTRLLPKEWQYVRVWEPDVKGNIATIKIECLYKTEEKANE
jgi:hypothetical protein